MTQQFVRIGKSFRHGKKSLIAGAFSVNTNVTPTRSASEDGNVVPQRVRGTEGEEARSALGAQPEWRPARDHAGPGNGLLDAEVAFNLTGFVTEGCRRRLVFGASHRFRQSGPLVFEERISSNGLVGAACHRQAEHQKSPRCQATQHPIAKLSKCAAVHWNHRRIEYRKIRGRSLADSLPEV